MNDFTRDELVSISDILKWAYRANSFVFIEYKFPKGLGEKLQGMIDKNYECDHEFRLCKSYYGVEEHRYRCTKCRIAYEDLK